VKSRVLAHHAVKVKTRPQIECLRLRVKDLDFAANQIVVREGKGNKDRITMFPAVIKPALITHLTRVREVHQRDLQRGFGRVVSPDALARKYPNAEKEWGWQWVFPASQISEDPRSGEWRRHHLHDSVPQKAVRTARHKSGSSNLLIVTLCAIPSLHICWLPGMTFGLFRNYSDTEM